VRAHSAQAAISRVQSANSAVDKQLTDLQRLQANQVLLRLTEQRLGQATRQVAADRRRAAANLASKQRLEDAAAAAEATVEHQVAALQVQRSDLATAKSAELGRIRTMERERDHLADRLRRIAAAQAAAAARAAAAREAAARAAAARAAAAQSASNQGVASSAASRAAPSSDTGFLSWPVTNTYITSPYGMRMHPILHIWELHDGTDFHAACGTPVYAAADGRVISEYYNTGYGNRVIIDHGFVRGVSLATSYNHLTSFVAQPGEEVHRGQLIAYSGTTGYSTGCHLHFMVYVNGATVDPMTWL
jgi:murein DD-endopeptidase MepM/ murein hydrolase activator NlpD